MSEEPQKVISQIAQPYHVTLTKNAKGQYQWEISVHELTPELVLNAVNGLDDELRKRYNANGAEGKEGS